MTNETDPGTVGAANTDRELWREREGDYYANSIHVTATGANPIGPTFPLCNAA